MDGEGAAIQGDHDKFTVPRNPGDKTPGERGGQLAEVLTDHVRRGEAGAGDSFALQIGGEGSHHGLDFGKFRHLQRLVRVDEDIVPFNAHGEMMDAHRGVHVVFACAAVELETVPGTDHTRTLEDSFPQRTTGMRAGPIERVDLAADVAKREDLFAGLDLRDCAGGERGQRGHLDESHFILFYHAGGAPAGMGT